MDDFKFNALICMSWCHSELVFSPRRQCQTGAKFGPSSVLWLLSTAKDGWLWNQQWSRSPAWANVTFSFSWLSHSHPGLPSVHGQQHHQRQGGQKHLDCLRHCKYFSVATEKNITGRGRIKILWDMNAVLRSFVLNLQVPCKSKD